MSKTNTGLVEYASAMLGHPYWYGCYGQISTKELYKSKKKQYPKMYEWSCPKSQLGVRVFDCVGLIKGYLWSENINSNPKYNEKQDVSANGMLEKCKIKGKITSLPEMPGTLVFKKGHIGVYIGKGKVIEARGHSYGVVKTNLKDRNWTNWGYCPWIEYKTEKPKTDNKKEDGNKQTSVKYFKKYSGKSKSIADALKSVGAQNSYSYRKKIAKANSIKAYVGSASQNIKMLSLLKKGKLIKP